MIKSMRPQKTRVALPPMLCSGFLEYVLKYHKSPTTLVICSTREAFLEDLLASIKNTPSQEPSASQTSDEHTPHPLLIPTIHLIAKSQSINVIFAPTLPHLRAFLATSQLTFKSGQSASTMVLPASQFALLAIWGLANLHRSTAEYSAQGLSRTLASAVEAALQEEQKLVLAEPLIMHGRAVLHNVEVTEGLVREAWKEQVPLLIGSVRFGGEERVWAGRTIEVGRVVAKWCRFVRLDQRL